MNNRTILSAFSVVGAVMLLTGAIVYITGWTLSPYVYITGAVLFALSRWFSPHKGGTALRRLQRQQDISGLLLIAAVRRHEKSVARRAANGRAGGETGE